MEISLLKEPLGFLRFLEWVFAIAAFATCIGFNTHTGYHIDCKLKSSKANETSCFNVKVTQHISYPFHLDVTQNNFTASNGMNATSCIKTAKYLHRSGDFYIGAKVFVLVGVSTWLVATFYLALFIIYPYLYLGKDKKAPVVDLFTSLIIALFWLFASSAWAHGLTGLKHSSGDDWLYSSHESPCTKKDAQFMNHNITSCIRYDYGSFGGADASILMGFLNSFLWFCNLWFIYKETKWYQQRNPSYDQPEEIKT